MKTLATDERRTFHSRYKLNALYRHWSPILDRLKLTYGEADATTLWYLAERQIVRLRDEQSFREQEIWPMFIELRDDCRELDGAARSDRQAMCTAETVMCVVLTMLMNAVERGHEEESFANEPMCMAIVDLLGNDAYFQKLMAVFFGRKVGYDGQAVVIDPSDPMREGTMYEGFDAMATDEVTQMVKRVADRSEGLRALLGERWAAWEPLWLDICSDVRLFALLKKEEPRGTDWGMNQKMVLNVAGMVRDKLLQSTPIQAMNDLLAKRNMRSYISNHADYEGRDSVFDRRQHDTIDRLIEKRFLSNESI